MLRNKITSLILLLMLSGCASFNSEYMLNTTSLVSNVSGFQTFYTDVKRSIIDKQNNENVFTETEWNQFKRLDILISQLFYQSSSLLNGDIKSVNLTSIKSIWLTTEFTYSECRKFIEFKFDKFSPTEQIQLQILDSQAKEIKRTVEYFLNNPSTANVNELILRSTELIGITISMINMFNK